MNSNAFAIELRPQIASAVVATGDYMVAGEASEMFLNGDSAIIVVRALKTVPGDYHIGITIEALPPIEPVAARVGASHWGDEAIAVPFYGTFYRVSPAVIDASGNTIAQADGRILVLVTPADILF